MTILNIMFWEGDKAQAMELARLIADLEEAPRTDVTVLFSARFDCRHDEDTIEYVSKKFPVVRYTTKRRAEGWPNGPNQMMGGSYEFIVEQWKRGKLKCDRILFVEADCVPLRRDWINLLIEEFRNGGKSVLGALLKKDDAGIEHVNGNCMVDINFFRKCPGMIHPPSRGGWDATLAFAILPNACPSRLIWSDYQLGMEHNPWKGPDFLWEPKRYKAHDNPLFGVDLYPCWIHGVKTIQGIAAARERLINEQKDKTNT